jgi:hypothetical protein
MTIWKFGIHFGGRHNPPHYVFVRGEKIALGRINRTPFVVGDLVAITDGFKILNVVRVDEPRQPITNVPAYAFVAHQYNIAYVPQTIFAKATWRKIRQGALLPIQRGGCEIRNPELRALIQELWDQGVDI